MASMVAEAMEQDGTKIIRGAVPERIERLPGSSQFLVHWRGESGQDKDVFDTVFMAVGV